jgi:3-oxoacyl-(acyl-carrier-protein) synthase
MQNESSRAARPSDLLRFMVGAGGTTVSSVRKLGIPPLHLSAGSVSAACAIGEAFQRIRSGSADLMIAGGAECPLHVEILRTFRAAGVLADENEEQSPCRPFDERRTGTVLGEGAGVLILENAVHAARRGARPRARLGGYGFAAENYSMLAPDPNGSGVARATRMAMEAMSGEELGWIKTHGTGTRANDLSECRGLHSVFPGSFGEIPLVSFKSTMGHALGASGALEAVATVLSLEFGILPATLGTRRIDPALPRCTVSRRAEKVKVNSVLLLSESFGGRCAALLMNRA